jgi:hypothetical protein
MVTQISRKLYFIVAGLIITVNLTAQQDSIRALSQFLFPESSKATVKLKNGAVQNTLMNYNTISEKMVFTQNGKPFDLINIETIDTVLLMNKKFIPYNGFFLEVISGSGIPLFFQHRGELIAPGKTAGYGTTSQTSSITSVSTFYNNSQAYNLELPSDYTVKKSIIKWIKVNGLMEDFTNERQFLKIFKMKEADLKKFIKENKINFNKENDLIRLITYCNGLQ